MVSVSLSKNAGCVSGKITAKGHGGNSCQCWQNDDFSRNNAALPLEMRGPCTRPKRQSLKYDKQRIYSFLSTLVLFVKNWGTTLYLINSKLALI
jgi:hypothetical protein